MKHYSKLVLPEVLYVTETLNYHKFAENWLSLSGESYEKFRNQSHKKFRIKNRILTNLEMCKNVERKSKAISYRRLQFYEYIFRIYSI